jgi:hypothetical protein
MAATALIDAAGYRHPVLFGGGGCGHEVNVVDHEAVAPDLEAIALGLVFWGLEAAKRVTGASVIW